MQIYLDETGQFKKTKNGNYFVVGTFTVGDPRRTSKRFKSWRVSRFPRKLRYLSEVKFSNPSIDDKLRLRTLREISRLDVRIRYSYIKRENIPLDYRSKGKIRAGHLYTDIVANTLELYLPVNESEFRVFCDARHLKGIKRSEFKSLVYSRLIEKLPPKTILQIEMLDSTTDSNVQIADWICGALGRFHEQGHLGDECMSILKNNLLGEGVELFKDYWSNNQKTQSGD